MSRPSRSILAPGKLMLFGEYAVLEGAPCVVAAVARHARCRVDPPRVPGEVVVAAPALCAAEARPGGDPPGGPGDPLRFVRALLQVPDPAPGRYTLESEALFGRAGQKLGLGGSAAATVALAAALWPGADPSALFRIAHAAHRAAQGGVGSGADVAAGVFGGLGCYRPPAVIGEDARIEPLGGLSQPLLLAWTGRSASTPELIGAIDAFRRIQPGRHAAWMARIADGARAAAQALRGGDRGALAAQVEAAGGLIRGLGCDAGVPLWTEAHWVLAALARPFGGALKPTGAGGGDLAWLLAERPGAEDELAACLQAEGFEVLRLAIDRLGVRRASGPSIEVEPG